MTRRRWDDMANSTTKGLKRAAQFVHAEASSCPHIHTKKEARELAKKIYTQYELRLISDDLLSGDAALLAGMKVWRGEWERVEGQPSLYRSAAPDADPNHIISVHDFQEVGPGPRWLFVFAGLSKTTHTVEEVVGRVIREHSNESFPRPVRDDLYYVLLLVERETEEETGPRSWSKPQVDLEARATRAFEEDLPDLAKRFSIQMPPKEPEPEFKWFCEVDREKVGVITRDKDGHARFATHEERAQVMDRLSKEKKRA